MLKAFLIYPLGANSGATRLVVFSENPEGAKKTAREHGFYKAHSSETLYCSRIQKYDKFYTLNKKAYSVFRLVKKDERSFELKGVTKPVYDRNFRLVKFPS